MYAIKRLKAAKAAWYWVVHFRRSGKLHYRRFYDNKCGGSAAARRSAVVWRDEQLTRVRVLSVKEFCETPRGNNTSGVTGVHFLTPASQPEGKWQARLKLSDGTYHTKSFSVRRHGATKAFELAVEARKAMLHELDDRPYVHDPVALRFAHAGKKGTNDG